MNRKLVFIMVLPILVCMLSVALNVETVKASGTIYIRADGLVYPSDAPIHRDGNVYTLTGNVNDSIVVQRDNIEIDGAGLYIIEGPDDYASIGINLTGRSNIIITKIKEIKAFGYGIFLNMSSNIVLSENTVTANKVRGIYLSESSNCSITGNNITANWNYDIDLYYSSNNTICENIARRIGIHNDSSYNSIYRNQLSGSGLEAIVLLSSNNIIYENNITGNGIYGIHMDHSSNQRIYRNNITDNGIYGIYMDSCSNNIIAGNNIENHTVGIFLDSCPENTIFHNNFVENERNALILDSNINLWDFGFPSGGNYWSNYTGFDSDDDGIGDSSHVLDAENQDNYPLMGPISFFNAGTWNEATYYVETVSNSTVSDFYFSVDNRLISFDVAGLNDTIGFCRVAIPKRLLWCETYRIGQFE